GSLKTVFKKYKVRSSLDFVSDYSQWLYFTAYDRSPESYAIYRYHLQKQSTELVFDQPGTWFVADHRKGGELLLVKLTGGKWREYYEWNENKKVLTPLFGQNEKEEYSANYSAHRDELIVLTPKFDEHARLYRYRNGKFTPLSPAVEFEISDFVMDRKKTKILYQLNRNGYTELHGYQALSFEKLKFPTFKEAEHVVLGPISQDGKIISLGVAFPQSPRVSYTYNFENQKLQSWVVPSTPEIDLSRYVKAELEYYPARDGTKIPMFVRRPSHCLKKTCPVVVHFHGGPEAQSLPGFSAYAQLFVDRGFVYVDPNVRGSSGYGKNWLNSDNGPKRLNVISDIEDAALYIKKAWAYDGVTPQVGVMGGSYGGYSTLMAMTFFAGAYDVGVANVGMSNLLSFLQNTAPYRRHLRTSEYGDPEKDREALVQLSPITHINKIRAPLMIIQGVNDPRVPAGEAIQMHEALEKKGISSELILFADEGHG
ncbi:MAG: alpha/beta hydrolase family protein, partial [Bdellovibrionales bacterium]